MTNHATSAMRKQMLEDRIKNVASLLGINEDEAFMHIAYALLFNTEDDVADYEVDIVDGGGDKQIDIIRVEEFQDLVTIHLVQIKNNGKYEGNVIVQMRDALSWIFERPEDQYKKLPNESLIQKIGEIRELLSNLTAKNIEVIMHYVAKGDTTKLSPDFVQEIQNTESIYNGGNDFFRFSFKVWGVNELIERSYEIHQEKHRIDVNLPIYSIWNVPSYLQYEAKSIKSTVCIVEGTGLAKIVEEYGERLFEENVRTYLGNKKSANRKSVNDEILRTCSDDTEAEYFWFYNNGITVTCDSFVLMYSANPPVIKIDNIQIVNGCQTSMTLYQALKKGKLNNKTKVLFKVFATKDNNFIDRITLTTNSQNAVSDRDLRSNDELQRNLQELFGVRGYYYERKPRMFKDYSLSRSERKKIISNEKVGQAHIAVVQRQPAIAMAHSNKLWSDIYYQNTYGSSVEELIGSYLIYSYCVNRGKQIGKHLTGIDKAVVKYGNFHLARIIGSRRIGEYWRQFSTQHLAKQILDIESNPDILRDDYDAAQAILKNIVEELSNKDTSKLINVFKSDRIKQKLDGIMKKMN